MDTERLHIAIFCQNNWGNKLSEGDSFYRLLFKCDKKRENNEILTNEDVNWLFASYKKWFIKAESLLEECNEDNAGNQEAQLYGKQLKYDILQHVHTIITESQLENNELRNQLTIQADIEKAKLEREKRSKEEMQL